MQRIKLLAVAALVGLCGLAIGQAGQQQPKSDGNRLVAASAQQSPATAESLQSQLLENGTIMYLELSKSLDAKKAKQGDEVRASLLADVLSHGKIVLRQDSKLIGHVTEAQAFSKDKPESRLGIVFDKVIGKKGQETEFTSVLLAIRPAPRLHVESMTAPAAPYANPPGTPQEEKHYPIPKTPSPKLNTTMTREVDAKDSDDLRPTDIEGLSLQPSANGNSRVVVSFKNNVKLESGVRMELRVIQDQPKAAP